MVWTGLGFRPGLPFLGGSHRWTSVDRGLELLAEQQGRVDGYLIVPLFLNDLEPGLLVQFFYEHHRSCAVFSEQRFVPMSSSFGDNRSLSYRSNIEETACSSTFLTRILQRLVGHLIKAKESVAPDDIRNSCSCHKERVFSPVPQGLHSLPTCFSDLRFTGSKGLLP